MVLVPMALPCCHPCPRRAPFHPAQPPVGEGTEAECLSFVTAGFQLFVVIGFLLMLGNDRLFPRGSLSAVEVVLPASETQLQQNRAGAVQRQPFCIFPLLLYLHKY